MTLLELSRGGADAIHLKEFDILEGKFVHVPAEEGAFVLPEAKTRASYRSRNVLSIGSDFGPAETDHSSAKMTRAIHLAARRRLLVPDLLVPVSDKRKEMVEAARKEQHTCRSSIILNTYIFILFHFTPRGRDAQLHPVYCY